MKIWRAIRFAVTVFAVWGGTNLYMAARLIGPSGLTGPGRLAAWLAASVLAVMVPTTMFGQRRWRLPAWLTWTTYVYLGFALMLLPLVVVRDVLWAILAGTTAAWLGFAPDSAVPAMLTAWSARFAASGLLVLAAALLLSAAGFVEARRRPRSTRLSIPIRGLPAALEGFRIAHISDLHAGGTIGRRRLEQMVGVVNGFLPDLIALTGDLADGHVQELRDRVSPIADLKARHGVFFSTGNHEYYWDPHGWLDHVRSLGLTVLLNEHRMLRHGDADVLVGGVTDPSSEEMVPEHVSDPRAALARSPRADFKLLLAHQPRSAFAAAQAGVDLQLSGHTHGGQFFPWKHLVDRVQPFLAGLYPVGRMLLYVNRGAGYWGPPNRLGVPSEIALLTLTNAEQSA